MFESILLMLLLLLLLLSLILLLLLLLLLLLSLLLLLLLFLLLSLLHFRIFTSNSMNNSFLSYYFSSFIDLFIIRNQLCRIFYVFNLLLLSLIDLSLSTFFRCIYFLFFFFLIVSIRCFIKPNPCPRQ